MTFIKDLASHILFKRRISLVKLTEEKVIKLQEDIILALAGELFHCFRSCLLGGHWCHGWRKPLRRAEEPRLLYTKRWIKKI